MSDAGPFISVVMIGCGNFARRYHVPTLLARPDARLAAIVDPTPSEGAIALAQQTGALLVSELALVPDIACTVMAIVSSPHTLHAKHVEAALVRGWHVLCDKPFVMHAAEAEFLAAQADRHNLINAVAFNRRLDRGGLRARQALRSGAIGTVRFIQTIQLGYEMGGWFINPELGGGGPYSGRATHLADLVPWLIDRKPDRVRSRLRGGTPERTDRGGFIEVQFEGLECQLTCIEEGLAGWDEIRLFGDDGLIELRRPLKHPLGWEFRLLNQRGDASEFLEAQPVHGASTAAFFQALRGKGPVSCTFAEAIPSVAIIEKAFESGRSNGDWRVLGL